ncbi:MAG: glycosyltransferase family 4 protein [Candidatus Micrarchaeaceae archaeon]
MRILMMGELSRTGGGQKLLSDIYLSLRNTYRISIITDKNYKSDLGFDNVFRTSYTYSENLSKIQIFFRVLKLRKEIQAILKNNSYDLVFNNHPNIFISKGDINYLHGFSFLDPVIDENGNIKNKLLYEAIKRSGLYRIYDKANFLTHGKYTMDLSKKMFPLLGIVPGSIEYIFIPSGNFKEVNLRDKENVVLTFGRINREKELETVLDTAQRMNDTKFVIAGAVNEGDEDYFEMLKKTAPGNVKFIANPDENEKAKIFERAKVFLHTRRKEHFGITVAEAISYGCIPVVPQSGGPWVDIVERGKYGLGYIDKPDEQIKYALGEGIEFTKTILQSRERFSFETFREKIIDYFQRISAK